MVRIFTGFSKNISLNPIQCPFDFDNMPRVFMLTKSNLAEIKTFIIVLIAANLIYLYAIWQFLFENHQTIGTNRIDDWPFTQFFIHTSPCCQIRTEPKTNGYCNSFAKIWLLKAALINFPLYYKLFRNKLITIFFSKI